jgi:hypothetical protein
MKRGPKPKYGEPADSVVVVRVTRTQRECLERAAQTNLVTMREVIREAIDGYLSDYGDESAFSR